MTFVLQKCVWHSFRFHRHHLKESDSAVCSTTKAPSNIFTYWYSRTSVAQMLSLQRQVPDVEQTTLIVYNNLVFQKKCYRFVSKLNESGDLNVNAML